MGQDYPANTNQLIEIELGVIIGLLAVLIYRSNQEEEEEE